MIAETREKIKVWAGDRKADILTGIIIVLIGIISFGLGRLSATWTPKPPISIISPNGAESKPVAPQIPVATPIGASKTASITTSAGSPEGKFVASKSGAAYHLPDCPGAKQIKSENKIYFKTQEDAERAGYHPAGNCPGLSN